MSTLIFNIFIHWVTLAKGKRLVGFRVDGANCWTCRIHWTTPILGNWCEVPIRTWCILTLWHPDIVETWAIWCVRCWDLNVFLLWTLSWVSACILRSPAEENKLLWDQVENKTTVPKTDSAETHKPLPHFDTGPTLRYWPPHAPDHNKSHHHKGEDDDQWPPNSDTNPDTSQCWGNYKHQLKNKSSICKIMAKLVV